MGCPSSRVFCLLSGLTHSCSLSAPLENVSGVIEQRDASEPCFPRGLGEWACPTLHPGAATGRHEINALTPFSLTLMSLNCGPEKGGTCRSPSHPQPPSPPPESSARVPLGNSGSPFKSSRTPAGHSFPVGAESLPWALLWTGLQEQSSGPQVGPCSHMVHPEGLFSRAMGRASGTL